MDDDFDGSTYDPELDKVRLGGQLEKVRDIMTDGRWRTLRQLNLLIPEGTEAALSARIRDLRKPKFGGYMIKTRRVTWGNASKGLWEYKMLLISGEQSAPADRFGPDAIRRSLAIIRQDYPDVPPNHPIGKLLKWLNTHAPPKPLEKE